MLGDRIGFNGSPMFPGLGDDDKPYDVVVIGGALSGASTALLLLKRAPRLRVLIVEKSARLTRRVGEATVEISAFFMGRVLGLTKHLNESHLVKQGLRFWFANEDVAALDDASEIGPRYQVRLPSYQIDRSVLDEEVLRRAGEAGAQIIRPASVSKVKLAAGGEQTMTIRQGDFSRELRARWVVDASGVAALLARQEGWWQPNLEHPTSAAWGRWTGVKDWDGSDLAEKYPEWAAAPYGIRGTATNHVIGDGWWSWWIPLKGGDVSIGVVFDQRLVEWPKDGGNLGERLKSFLMRHPVAREMLADAQIVEDDAHWRKNLAYSTKTLVGDGFALVGDAAGFLDPFYSPGMDWIAFTASSAADLIGAQFEGESISERIASQNEAFSLSYRSWFEAVYRDKYEYLGEFDLLGLAFLLDLGLYYLGIVTQPFLLGVKALLMPPFSTPSSRPVFHLMRFYNGRFAAIARRRRALGLLGRQNCGRRRLTNGFTLSRGDITILVKTLGKWGWLEATEGWRSWGSSKPAPGAPDDVAPRAEELSSTSSPA